MLSHRTSKWLRWAHMKRRTFIRATAATVMFLGFKYLMLSHVLIHDSNVVANVIGGFLFWCVMFFTFDHLLED